MRDKALSILEANLDQDLEFMFENMLGGFKDEGIPGTNMGMVEGVNGIVQTSVPQPSGI